MSRQITVKSYQRVFRKPLRTARGEWAIRKGFIVRVEQDEQIGYGEVAPLPEFGSETLGEAKDFLQQLAGQPDLEVPNSLPCCAFALSSAVQEIDRSGLAKAAPQLESASHVRYNPVVVSSRDYAVSALLPAGAAALRRATDKVGAGYRSVKWKIGVEPIGKEIALARNLIESLPAGIRIRFDANASLSVAQLEQWLDLLSLYPEQVDYIEQPLVCGEEGTMARYMEASGVTIALDESLNGVGGHRWLEPSAWSGVLVIKAPLLGDVTALVAQLESVAEKLVFSSVFETGIGLENSLCLADALPKTIRPVGFDTMSAFDDKFNHLTSAPIIRAAARSAYDPELIWNSI